MAFFNYSTMQMTAKVVYYGPGLCGKTTNLQYIYGQTEEESRGEMVSLETQTDRTLFFDLLPLDVGTVAGFRTKIQLYTVPGQVFYNTTRKLVLKGVDGVVFVADSQEPMLQSNIESLANLGENLAELGVTLDAIPLVLQYNKRDLPSVCSVATLDEALNRHGWESYEASALTGQGVFETLRGISRLTLLSLREQLELTPGASDRVRTDAAAVDAPTEGPAEGQADPLEEPAAEATAASAEDETAADAVDEAGSEESLAAEAADAEGKEGSEPLPDAEPEPTPRVSSESEVATAAGTQATAPAPVRSDDRQPIPQAAPNAAASAAAGGNGEPVPAPEPEALETLPPPQAVRKDLLLRLNRQDFQRTRQVAIKLSLQEADGTVVRVTRDLQIPVDTATDEAILRLNLALRSET